MRGREREIDREGERERYIGRERDGDREEGWEGGRARKSIKAIRSRNG